MKSKFKSNIFSLLQMNSKKKKLWFDCMMSRKTIMLLNTLTTSGVITTYVAYKKNHTILIRVFLKYFELQSTLMSHVVLHYKPTLRLSIRLKTINKLSNVGNGAITMISTSHGIKTLRQCQSERVGGFLAYVIYVRK
jgi:ribosomal protein S8